MKLPELKRLAAHDAGPEVKGACYGLTAGRNKQPYVPSAASKVQSLIRMVRGHLKKTDPDFTFTSLQVNANARAPWHVDQSNVGESRALMLGPCEAGQLCVHAVDGPEIQLAPKGAWFGFDGRRPHSVLPFAGERIGVVAFTHTGIHTAAAKAWTDKLVQQGFAPPPNAGTPILYPVSKADNDRKMAAAWRAYVNSCEGVMHHITTESVGQAQTSKGRNQSSHQWPAVMAWFVSCICLPSWGEQEPLPMEGGMTDC